MQFWVKKWKIQQSEKTCFEKYRAKVDQNVWDNFLAYLNLLNIPMWVTFWWVDGGGGCRWHPMPFRLENGYNRPSLARLVTDQSQWVLLLQNITLNCCFQSSLPILLSQVANLTCSSFRRELASSLHPRLHRHRTDFLSRSAKSGGTAGNLWHLSNYNDK